MGGILATWGFIIANIILFRYPRWPVSLIELKLDGRYHSDTGIQLKLFYSDIQDGHHGGLLEILQTTSPPKPYVRLSQKLMGGIIVTHSELLTSFRSIIQDGQHGGNILKFFKQHPSQTISQIEPKLDGRRRSDIEIQNC